MKKMDEKDRAGRGVAFSGTCSRHFIRRHSARSAYQLIDDVVRNFTFLNKDLTYLFSRNWPPSPRILE